MLVRWIIGVAIGSAIFLIASPLFVRSYATHQINRSVTTLASGQIYRWRSEGYANTAIGPAGMPGKIRVLDRDEDVIRIALWGDSQAEGVAVADVDKLFAAIDRRFKGRVETFPFARSGDALGRWVAQVQSVEKQFGIDRHLFLICQTDDLLEIAPPTPSVDKQSRNDAGVERFLPAAAIEAARHFLTQPDGSPRQFRLAVGPVSRSAVDRDSGEPRPNDAADFAESLGELRRVSDKPIDILYAPLSPQIVGGEVRRGLPDGERPLAAARAAEQLGIRWIDAAHVLASEFEHGQPPHGFDNGRPATGHLNASGYRVLAKVFAESFDWQ